MTEAEESMEVLVLEGEDGKEYECELLDRFEFEDGEYVLLLKLPEELEGEEELDPDEDGQLIIMKVHTRGEQTVFQTIESEEEFDRVKAYVEEMVEAERQALGAE